MIQRGNGDTSTFSAARRPWRALGAGICIVLGVMFFVGDSVFDVATAVRRPILFTLYWLVMMGLIAWLCGLAIRDVAHTRRMMALWRAERAEGREDRAAPS